mmetsp:Transcript_41517/g.104713  ORF Transcript_41517/g.104713 Transcript_41517/m.104713 type:complete len:411 (-) Transcript_41517:54-1286(-)|eukprot:CAMPEP_0177649074 /NCGR_PEP_ID=MMETSP0447-20121125/11173_1 /TAXON_ID=0 /ORGANISM="Stygamoeba regulata, Strain BSH-02190019" /LENGTH=410 /DNA_ID=CAMNT_0019151769 /DNA_START=68 /DNA_END=1300 /DNA_ORIENTATION=+
MSSSSNRSGRSTSRQGTDSHNQLDDGTYRFAPRSGIDWVMGRRWDMQDTHVLIDNVNKYLKSKDKSKVRGFWAVYDGHGGRDCAEICEEVLHRHLLSCPKFESGDYTNAFLESFELTEKECLKKARSVNYSCGSTACAALMIGRTLLVCNLGDCEAILARRKMWTKGWDIVELTEVHRPVGSEKKRIIASGGKVTNGRVCGNLAVTRAFGDFDMKTPWNESKESFVLAEPTFREVKLNRCDDFLIIACDGLWDKVNHKEAIEIVGKVMRAKQHPDQAAEKLIAVALEKGTQDNVTVVVVFLWKVYTDSAQKLPVAFSEPNVASKRQVSSKTLPESASFAATRDMDAPTRLEDDGEPQSGWHAAISPRLMNDDDGKTAEPSKDTSSGKGKKTPRSKHKTPRRSPSPTGEAE